MIIILPQVKIKAADLSTVKVVANNSEVSQREAEAKDLSTFNANFRTTGFREAHIRVAAINTVATTNPISREINLLPIEVEAMARVLNTQEDVVMVGPITRVIRIISSISITLMISRRNPVAYVVVLINLLPIEVESMAGVLNTQEDVVMVGPITRVIRIISSISITLMISRRNPVAYVVVLINLPPIEVEAMAGVLNTQEDVVMVGPITRVIIIISSISITLTISRWNPVAYSVVLIIPLSTATKESMI